MYAHQCNECIDIIEQILSHEKCNRWHSYAFNHCLDCLHCDQKTHSFFFSDLKVSAEIQAILFIITSSSFVRSSDFSNL